jgi:hypothetical protein
VSSLEAFFIVCAVLLVGTPVCLWQIHQAWKAEQAKYGADPTPDPRWGTDVALHDECALILSMPAYGTGDHTTTNPTGDQT